jgi:DNA-binding PadR family transcriptional regulator
MNENKETEYLTSLTKFYTLALLSSEPRHGYEIIKEVGERIGKEPSTGQIYPLLEKMEEEGIAKTKKKEVEGRKRKIYKLTEKGQKLFSKISKKFYNLLHEILDPWLVECAHCGCKIFEGHSKDEESGSSYKEEINGKELSFCCEHCAKAYRKMK